jgi:hypothetical protein
MKDMSRGRGRRDVPLSCGMEWYEQADGGNSTMEFHPGKK